MVTHQLQVKCRPGKVRRSKTDVLPLSYTANVDISVSVSNENVAVEVIYYILTKLETEWCCPTVSKHRELRVQLASSNSDRLLHHTQVSVKYHAACEQCIGYYN